MGRKHKEESCKVIVTLTGKSLEIILKDKDKYDKDQRIISKNQLILKRIELSYLNEAKSKV